MTERTTESGLVVVEGSAGQGIQESCDPFELGIIKDILQDVCASMAPGIGNKIDLYWLVTMATDDEINGSQENIQLWNLVMNRAAQRTMDLVLQEKHGDKDGLNPSIVMGHSVGEFAELIRKNVINEEYAAYLVYERARSMAMAGELAREGEYPGYDEEELDGGAIVVIGVDEDRLNEIAVENNCTYVRVAARNLPDVLTISGPLNQLQIVGQKVAEESGTQPVEVATNVMVHHEIFMEIARDGLTQAMYEKFKFNRDPLPNSVILLGEFANTALVAATSLRHGVDRPVEFYKGSQLAVTEALKDSESEGQVLLVEPTVNPDKAALVPMWMRMFRADKRVIPASFQDILTVGKDVEAIKELQSQRRKERKQAQRAERG